MPASGATATAHAAEAALRKLPDFDRALGTGDANYPAFAATGGVTAETKRAERAVTGPRIRELCTHAKDKSWSPGDCGVCSDLGIDTVRRNTRRRP